MILCLDPGATSGVALFFADGGLRAATKCKPAEVLPWTLGKVGGMSEKISTLVHEKPQIYTRGKSKGNPNKLLGLYAQALEIYAQIPHVRRTEYTPAEWKGQVDKPVHHGRVLATLTPAERASLPTCKVSKTNPHGYDNNMLDAIGLGLFYTGRTGRGCTRK
jgi:hypothetical protein